MEIRSGKPFANTIMTLRGSAGGMDQGKGYTEGLDNTRDEGGSNHYSFLVNCDDNLYFCEFNFAKGLRQIAHLIGLAKDTPRKMNVSESGAFSNGLTADLAFKDPILFYAESVWTGKDNGKDTTEFHTMKFRFKDFVTKYEEHPENIGSVSVNEYIAISDDRPSAMNATLVKISARIPDKSIQTEFNKIVAHTSLKQSMFRLYQLKKDTSINGDYYRGFIPNLQMYYFKALKDGFIIKHTQDDKLEDNTFIINKENTIDPLADRVKFPVLCWSAEIKLHGDAKSAAISFWNEATPGIKETVYIYPSLDARKTKCPDISDKPPVHWGKSLPYVILQGEMNILDDKTSTDQFCKLNRIKGGSAPYGSDIQSTNDLRGIMLQWVYRLIGKPHWPKKRSKDDWGFGDIRNAQNPRCVVSIRGDNADSLQQKRDCIEALKIPSNKHNNRMDECDKMIRIVFAITYGTLVNCYSCYSRGKNKNGRTTPWNLLEFKNEILKTWFPISAPPDPAPAPAPVPAPPSVLAPIVPIPPPTQQTDIRFDNDPENRQVDILLRDGLNCNIEYPGQFAITRDYLRDVRNKIGDQRFIQYAKKLEVLNDEFFQ